MTNDRIHFLGCVLKSRSLKGLVIYLSEGAPTDASARREFAMLKGTGLITEGVVVVHGTALRAQGLQRHVWQSGFGLVAKKQR